MTHTHTTKLITKSKFVRKWLLFLQQKHHQSASETGANKTVDDEVDGGVEHDHVPDNAVQKPPLGGDVVGTLPSEAFKDVCDGGDLIDREGHLWYVEDNEDNDNYHHGFGQPYF